MSRIKDMARIAIVSSLYVALTLVFGFMSYGNIQFRVAEILILLCFFRKDYSIALILGCAISNIFSPLGIVDVIFGTVATVLSAICVMYSKRIFVSAIYPVIFNGLIVGLELYYVLSLPFVYSAISVMIGEAVVLFIGALVFNKLRRNKAIMEIIEANQNI